MAAYYNEIDPFAAEWLRQLIKAGHIADGVVDERSIADVTARDVREFTQCHFFAGIGVWSYALRQAGWADDRPVWTGSCPCQPFSSAGKGKGTADERHLWPEFGRLIRECRPVTILGEQVANAAGESWFDIVRADMEAEDYAAGLAVFPACGVGAPHKRKRLYWTAVDQLANDDRERRDWKQIHLQPRRQDQKTFETTRGGGSCGLANDASDGSQGGLRGGTNTQREDQHGHAGCSGAALRPCPTNGHWGDADWLFCRDGKWRPVEPGTFPLAHGATARIGRLRGYGNAIVAQQAQAWIETVMEVI